MSEDRPRYGPIIAAVGSGLLAWSVFLPWYGVTLTADGAALMQGYLARFAAEFGNAALQTRVSGLHSAMATVAGHEIATVSAHQVLHTINVVLLVVAAICLVLALVRLAGRELPLQASGSMVALGGLALLCVLYRMTVRPDVDHALFSFSLRGGIWLALGSSLAIIVGALWGRQLGRSESPYASPEMISFAPAASTAGTATAPQAPAPASGVPQAAAVPPTTSSLLLAAVPPGRTVYVSRSDVRQDLDGSGWVNCAAAVSEAPDAVHVVAVAMAAEGIQVTLSKAVAQIPPESSAANRPDWRPAWVSVV